MPISVARLLIVNLSTTDADLVVAISIFRVASPRLTCVVSFTAPKGLKNKNKSRPSDNDFESRALKVNFQVHKVENYYNSLSTIWRSCKKFIR